MSRSTLSVTLTLALLGGGFILAQPPKKDAPVGDEKQVIKSTPSKVVPAASIKFRKDLNVSYPSLSTLGSRVDAARRSGDPVALAHAASELNVAESISGKTSSLTSKQLMSESAQLASLRRQNAEMKAVLKASDQVALADDQNQLLKKLLAIDNEEKKAIAIGQEPTDAPRKITVNNYSTQYIDVQINGYLRGQVLPGTTRVFTVEQRWNPIVLKGWGDSDETTFGPVVLQGRFSTYTWNINGDDAIPNMPE